MPDASLIGPSRASSVSNAVGQSSSVPSSSPIRCVVVVRPSAEPWQMMGELRSPRRPVVRDVVAPEVQLVADALVAEQPREALVLSSAPVVSSHCPWPQTSRTLSRARSQSRWSPPAWASESIGLLK